MVAHWVDGANLPQALRVVPEILESNPRVLTQAVAVVGINALDDSSVNIAGQPGVSVPGHGAAQLEIYQAIIERFRGEKVEIPFPRREIRLLNYPGSATATK